MENHKNNGPNHQSGVLMSINAWILMGLKKHVGFNGV